MTPVGLAGLRDPARSVANEEARFPPHGKQAISFGKLDLIPISANKNGRRMMTFSVRFLLAID
ncbi:hypothetical protein BBI11_08035 [Planococcus maritimus]|nr:hypothetical protein BBI11_08035 [Planococcus maritimus]